MDQSLRKFQECFKAIYFITFISPLNNYLNELSLFTGLTTVAIAADLLFTAFEKGIILDFGTGCFSQGHLRSGKIKRVYTGPLSEPGHSATTTFKKFKIDTIPVWRAHKIINTTYSAAGAN